MRVDSDHTRVAIEVEIAMAEGHIRATVVLPRAGIFRVPQLYKFSDEELAVLVFLNAGVPASWGAAPWFRWWTMVGLTSKQSIGSRLRQLSKNCPHDDGVIRKSLAALDQHLDNSSAEHRAHVAHNSIAYVAGKVFTQGEVDALVTAAAEQAAEQAAAKFAEELNAHLRDTAAARSIDAQSNRGWAKQERHLVLKPFQGKRNVVTIGGKQLRSLPRQLISGLREGLCRKHGVPPIHGLYGEAEGNGQLTCRPSRSEKTALAPQCTGLSHADEDNSGSVPLVMSRGQKIRERINGTGGEEEDALRKLSSSELHCLLSALVGGPFDPDKGEEIVSLQVDALLHKADDGVPLAQLDPMASHLMQCAKIAQMLRLSRNQPASVALAVAAEVSTDHLHAGVMALFVESPRGLRVVAVPEDAEHDQGVCPYACDSTLPCATICMVEMHLVIDGTRDASRHRRYRPCCPWIDRPANKTQGWLHKTRS